MKNFKVLIFILLLFPGLLSAEEKSKGNSDFLLSKHKAGCIEIGMPVDSIYAGYDRELTSLVDLFLEGMFSPALEIYLNGKEKKKKPSMIVEIGCGEDWIITRINVYDKKFKTSKGIGVGSTLGDIRKSYKVEWISSGEGTIFARVEEMEMSFALNIVKVPPKRYKTKGQNLIPDSAKVEYVLID